MITIPRYPEVYTLNNANSTEIISCLTESFARFGIPKVVVSDNGSVFVSKELENFLSSLGITHIRSSNYHPQSNGTIERFHSTLKSRLRRLQVDSLKLMPLSLSLINKVLFDIRSTPHSVTGETPFQRFFNRPMRTKLTSLANDPLPSVAPTRDVTAEYSKMYMGRNIQYSPGDLVFVRQGKGNPFELKAKVIKSLQNNSYLLQTNTGLMRKYNQCDLKCRFDATDSTQQDLIRLDALDAYENLNGLSVKNENTQVANSSRYSLRPNRADMQIYKE